MAHESRLIDVVQQVREAEKDWLTADEQQKPRALHIWSRLFRVASRSNRLSVLKQLSQLTAPTAGLKEKLLRRVQRLTRDKLSAHN